jgi:hypothetical protein
MTTGLLKKVFEQVTQPTDVLHHFSNLLVSPVPEGAKIDIEVSNEEGGMSFWKFVEGLFDLWKCAKVGGRDVTSHDVKALAPVTTTKDSTLGPQMRQSSTLYVLLACQKSTIPPWCPLGALDATMEYPLEFRVYIPPVSLVSIKTQRSTSIASIARKVDSNPTLQPLWMFNDAAVMDPLPSVCDGRREAVNAMGFLP